MVSKRKASSQQPSTPSSRIAAQGRAADKAHDQAAQQAASQHASSSSGPIGSTSKGQRFYTAPVWYEHPIEWLDVVWKRYEATFAFSMLETWEIVLLHSIFFFSFFLIYMACRSYLPNHLRVISRRAKYYLLGNEDFISL